MENVENERLKNQRSDGYGLMPQIPGISVQQAIRVFEKVGFFILVG